MRHPTHERSKVDRGAVRGAFVLTWNERLGDSVKKRLLIRHAAYAHPGRREKLGPALRAATERQNQVADRCVHVRRVNFHVDDEGFWLEESAPDGATLAEVEELVSQAATEVRGAGEVARLGVQLCDALIAASYADDGAVWPHGSIRARCLSLVDGTLLVSDFGVAEAMVRELDERASIDALDTVEPYTPPETWKKPGVFNQRRDQFAIGVLLFELATGSHPYRIDRSDPNDCKQIITRSPSKAIEKNPKLPPALAEALDRAVHREEEKRFAKIQDLRAVLREFVPADRIEQLRQEWDRLDQNDLAALRGFLDRVRNAKTDPEARSRLRLLEDLEGKSISAIERIARATQRAEFRASIDAQANRPSANASELVGILERIDALASKAVDEQDRSHAQSARKRIVDAHVRERVAVATSFVAKSQLDKAEGVLADLDTVPDVSPERKNEFKQLEARIRDARERERQSQAAQLAEEAKLQGLQKDASETIRRFVETVVRDGLSVLVESDSVRVSQVLPAEKAAKGAWAGRATILLAGGAGENFECTFHLGRKDGVATILNEREARSLLDAGLNRLLVGVQRSEIQRFAAELRSRLLPNLPELAPIQAACATFDLRLADSTGREAIHAPAVGLRWNPSVLRWEYADHSQASQALGRFVADRLLHEGDRKAGEALQAYVPAFGSVAVTVGIRAPLGSPETLTSIPMDVTWRLVGLLAELLPSRGQDQRFVISYPQVDWKEFTRSLERCAVEVREAIAVREKRQIEELIEKVKADAPVRVCGATVSHVPQIRNGVLDGVICTLTAPDRRTLKVRIEWDPMTLRLIERPDLEARLTKWAGKRKAVFPRRAAAAGVGVLVVATIVYLFVGLLRPDTAAELVAGYLVASSADGLALDRYVHADAEACLDCSPCVLVNRAKTRGHVRVEGGLLTTSFECGPIEGVIDDVRCVGTDGVALPLADLRDQVLKRVQATERKSWVQAVAKAVSTLDEATQTEGWFGAFNTMAGQSDRASETLGAALPWPIDGERTLRFMRRTDRSCDWVPAEDSGINWLTEELAAALRTSLRADLAKIALPGGVGTVDDFFGEKLAEFTADADMTFTYSDGNWIATCKVREKSDQGTTAQSVMLAMRRTDGAWVLDNEDGKGLNALANLIGGMQKQALAKLVTDRRGAAFPAASTADHPMAPSLELDVSVNLNPTLTDPTPVQLPVKWEADKLVWILAPQMDWKETFGNAAVTFAERFLTVNVSKDCTTHLGVPIVKCTPDPNVALPVGLHVTCAASWDDGKKKLSWTARFPFDPIDASRTIEEDLGRVCKEEALRSFHDKLKERANCKGRAVEIRQVGQDPARFELHHNAFAEPISITAVWVGSDSEYRIEDDPDLDNIKKEIQQRCGIDDCTFARSHLDGVKAALAARTWEGVTLEIKGVGDQCDGWVVTLPFPFVGVEGKDDNAKEKKKDVQLGELDLTDPEKATDGEIADAILGGPLSVLEPQIDASQHIKWLSDCGSLHFDDCPNSPGRESLKQFWGEFVNAANIDAEVMRDLASKNQDAYFKGTYSDWAWKAAEGKATGLMSIEVVIKDGVLPSGRTYNVKDMEIENAFRLTVPGERDSTWGVEKKTMNFGGIPESLKRARGALTQVKPRKELGEEFEKENLVAGVPAEVTPDKLARWIRTSAQIKTGASPAANSSLVEITQQIRQERQKQGVRSQDTHFFELVYDGMNYYALHWRASLADPPVVISPRVMSLGKRPQPRATAGLPQFFGKAFDGQLEPVDGVLNVLIGGDGPWATGAAIAEFNRISVELLPSAPGALEVRVGIASLKEINEAASGNNPLRARVDKILSLAATGATENEKEKAAECQTIGEKLLPK